MIFCRYLLIISGNCLKEICGASNDTRKRNVNDVDKDNILRNNNIENCEQENSEIPRDLCSTGNESDSFFKVPEIPSRNRSS